MEGRRWVVDMLDDGSGCRRWWPEQFWSPEMVIGAGQFFGDGTCNDLESITVITHHRFPIPSIAVITPHLTITAS
ncbi:hypothetical protein L6452_33768 [Arctium lappa]|uniref:Uncharacterized protein n=1 Tax=Arctium lappa TaxID=4217 RepID=A0ACB8YGW9_ARCLA|nr:hypothetical protein L6452_33768 [Arctium lappa]